jgi:hypothetical protein
MPIVRALDVLDLIMIQADESRLVVITSYESETAAIAAGRPLLAFLDDHYADKISLVARTIGRAYDPREFLAADVNPEHPGWDEDEAMFANVNTYQIAPAYREVEAFEAFLNSVAAGFLSVLSRFGLLDMLVVRTSLEEMIVVRLFGNPEHFDRALSQAQAEYSPDNFAGKIELISSVRGPAYDANFLQL